VTTTLAPTPAALLLPDTPYKGLMPYGEDDAPFFFGRDVWRDIITDNLKAYRLTLLYGESGVGKSSVLRAGVAHHLRLRAEQNREEDGTPDLAVAVLSSWRVDPLGSLLAALRQAAADALGEEQPEPPANAPRDLEATLEECADRVAGRLFVILDQFEEFFLYHAADEASANEFADAFARAVGRRDIRASFLISIREDALAKLDRFKGRIPNLFDNYLRIEHLDRESAGDAVRCPLERYNDALQPHEAVALEPELAEAVLDQVEAGTILLGQAAGGAAAPTTGGQARIETPYLQLVLTRLWSEEMAAGSRVLRLETLQRLGGAAGIVETHLDAAMNALPPSERDIAARVFRYLVTKSRTKIAHRTSDLADWTEVPEGELTVVLEKLSSGSARILRPAGESSFEIYHDVLAEAVLAWRTSHEAERRLEEERRESEARYRRTLMRLGVVVGGIALAVAVVLATVALSQRDEAQHQADVAQSREVASSALAQLPDVDPELGLLLASWAVDREETSEATDALRQALRVARIRTILRGHEGAVRGAAFSPDDSTIVTAGVDGTARLWDPLTGRQRALLRGHRGAVFSASFSPDGERIVTSGKDRTARIWDTATGQQLAVLRTRRRFEVPEGTFAPWQGSSFSPDGTRVLMAGFDGAARLWDVASGRELALFGGEGDKFVNSASFSPDGRLILTSSDDDAAHLWEAATGRHVRAFRGHEDDVGRARFSPDGGRIVTASVDGSVRIWEASSGTQLLRFDVRDDDGRVLNATFSPDGRRVAVAALGGRVEIRDALSGALVAAPSGHTSLGFTPTAAFDAGGDLVVTAGDDGTARVWRTANGENVAVLSGHGKRIRGAAFSTDGRLVVTAGEDGTARVWRTASNDRVSSVRGPGGPAVQASLTGDGTLVATAAPGGTAHVWETASGKAVTLLPGADERLSAAAVSRNGRLVTGGQDGAVRIWNGDTGEQLAVLRGASADVWSPFLSRDGKRVVARDEDGSTHIWNAATGKRIAVVRGRGGDRAFAVPSADGRQIIATGVGETADLWGTMTGKRVRVLPVGGSLWTALFSADGELVVTTTHDGVVRVWDTATGRPTLGPTATAAIARSLAPGVRPQLYVDDVSSDGRLLAISTTDHGVLIWDTRRRRPVLPRSRLRSMWSASFSPDAKRVVTTHREGASSLWSTTTGKQLAVLPDASAYGASFGGDGRHVLTIGGRGVLRVWRVAGRRPVVVFTARDVDDGRFSPDGRLVVVVRNGEAVVHDLATDNEVRTFAGDDRRFLSASVAATGSLVVTARADGLVQAWDARTRREVSSFRPGGRVSAAYLDPTGGHLVTIGIKDKKPRAQVWNASTGQSVSILEGHEQAIRSAAFSRDGTRLVTASLSARVWETSTGDELAVLEGHRRRVNSAAFSPDGALVVTASADGTARVWDPRAEEKQLVVLRGHRGGVGAAAFSPDGELVATGGVDGTVRIWESRSGRSVAVVGGGPQALRTVAFGRDGQSVVGVDETGTASSYACDVCVPVAELRRLAESRVGRSLTADERRRLLHEE
jgi:WD40 repeat protein